MEPSSILIVVIGVVVVAALILFAICYCRMNQTKLQRYRSPAKKEANITAESGIEDLPISKVFTDDEFCWSREGCSEGFTIEDTNNIVLITHQLTGTHAARSNLGFLRGRHVWEVTWPRDCRDNHSCIGVGTYQAPLYNRGLLDLVGFNIQSWGWNITNQNLIHNNRNIRKYPDSIGQQQITPDQIIVSLDMERGTLSFGSFQSSFGVAFNGLNGGRLPLFPMISTASLDVRVTIKYIGSACLPSQTPVPSNHQAMTSGNITAYTTHKAVNRTPNARFEPSITPGSIMKSIRRSFKRRKKNPHSAANTPVSTIGKESSYQMRRDPRRNLYQRDKTAKSNPREPPHGQYSPGTQPYPAAVYVAEVHVYNTERGNYEGKPQGVAVSRRGHENASYQRDANDYRDEYTTRTSAKVPAISPRYDKSRQTEIRDTRDNNLAMRNYDLHNVPQERNSTYDELGNPIRPGRRAKRDQQSSGYRNLSPSHQQGVKSPIQQQAAEYTYDQQSPSYRNQSASQQRAKYTYDQHPPGYKSNNSRQQHRHESGHESEHRNNPDTTNPVRPNRKSDTHRYTNDTQRSEIGNTYKNPSFTTNSTYSSKQYNSNGHMQYSPPVHIQSDYSKSNGTFNQVSRSPKHYRPSLENDYRAQPPSSFNV